MVSITYKRNTNSSSRIDDIQTDIANQTLVPDLRAILTDRINIAWGFGRNSDVMYFEGAFWFANLNVLRVDLQTGVLSQFIPPNSLRCFRITHDGKYIYTATEEGSILCINPQTLTIVNQRNFGINSIYDIECDGSILIISSSEGMFYVHTGFMEILASDNRITDNFKLYFDGVYLWSWSNREVRLYHKRGITNITSLNIEFVWNFHRVSLQVPGVIRDACRVGSMLWVAVNNTIQIIRIRNSQLVSNLTFETTVNSIAYDGRNIWLALINGFLRGVPNSDTVRFFSSGIPYPLIYGAIQPDGETEPITLRLVGTDLYIFIAGSSDALRMPTTLV